MRYCTHSPVERSKSIKIVITNKARPFYLLHPVTLNFGEVVQNCMGNTAVAANFGLVQRYYSPLTPGNQILMISIYASMFGATGKESPVISAIVFAP
mmetsp:Transcript_5613/g.10247  ORF Transcript_5613/g.10247 Transcript_5613/m.10247 type:complete len:97 (+) Transcript_5613:139-429(+)